MLCIAFYMALAQKKEIFCRRTALEFGGFMICAAVPKRLTPHSLRLTIIF